VSGHPGAGERT